MAELQPTTREARGGRDAPRRVLMVRPSALGDVARTVPAAVAIKRAWPGCRLEWLVNRGFADAVRWHPCVDEVIPFDRDRPAAVWALMRELKRKRFDVVYDLQGLARSGLLTWATRAKRRVGFADAREGGWLGCNVRHRVERSGGGGGGVWAVERMLGLLAADGVAVPGGVEEVTADLRVYVGEDDTAWASAWRSEQGVEDGAYLVVAPTAKWGCKRWPVERFASVAGRVLGEGLAEKVVVVCGPGERDGVRAGFEAGLRSEQNKTAMTVGGLASRVVWPDTSVGQLMAVLAGTRGVVCNDSAALHLAVGLGVPTVSVFGPTDPALVGPWGGVVVEGDAGGGGLSVVPNVSHLVIRAPGAADGAVDYRRHKDDDTLIRGVSTGVVAAAVSRNL